MAGAEASNGSAARSAGSRGRESSRCVALAAARPLRARPDRRSARAAPTASESTRRMPMPRASISPAIVSGARTRIASPSRRNSLRSSATSRAPASISRRARSDLPLPDGPRSSTRAIADRHRRRVDEQRFGHQASGRRIRKRAPQTSPDAIVPVLGPDAAAMRLDDLLRDRQAEPRMGAECLTRRALGIEAVEDRGQSCRAGCRVRHPRP